MSSQRRTAPLLEQFDAGLLFPAKGKLDGDLRTQLDNAIFHGGTLSMETTGRRRYELMLKVDKQHDLPSIAWTAGQREFVPLLLSLYPLLPAGAVSKPKNGFDWVIIEEPEMGLHPKAIITTMYVVLELIRRGYRVALSTHHPIVVDVLWAIRTLRDADPATGSRLLLKALGASSTARRRRSHAPAWPRTSASMPSTT